MIYDSNCGYMYGHWALELEPGSPICIRYGAGQMKHTLARSVLYDTTRGVGFQWDSRDSSGIPVGFQWGAAQWRMALALGRRGGREAATEPKKYVQVAPMPPHGRTNKTRALEIHPYPVAGCWWDFGGILVGKSV